MWMRLKARFSSQDRADNVSSAASSSSLSHTSSIANLTARFFGDTGGTTAERLAAASKRYDGRISARERIVASSLAFSRDVDEEDIVDPDMPAGGEAHMLSSTLPAGQKPYGAASPIVNAAGAVTNGMLTGFNMGIQGINQGIGMLVSASSTSSSVARMRSSGSNNSNSSSYYFYCLLVCHRQEPTESAVLLFDDTKAERRFMVGRVSGLAPPVLTIPLCHQVTMRIEDDDGEGDSQGPRILFSWHDGYTFQSQRSILLGGVSTKFLDALRRTYESALNGGHVFQPVPALRMFSWLWKYGPIPASETLASIVATGGAVGEGGEDSDEESGSLSSNTVYGIDLVDGKSVESEDGGEGAADAARGGEGAAEVVRSPRGGLEEGRRSLEWGEDVAVEYLESEKSEEPKQIGHPLVSFNQSTPALVAGTPQVVTRMSFDDLMMSDSVAFIRTHATQRIRYDQQRVSVASSLRRGMSSSVNESLNPVTVVCVTYNAGGTVGKSSKMAGVLNDVKKHLLTSPDIFVIGLQEAVPLNTKHILLLKNSYRLRKWVKAWEAAIKDCVKPWGHKYQLAGRVDQVGLLLMKFVRTDRASDMAHFDTMQVKTGMRGLTGNKGAVALGAHFCKYTGLCFINVHLSAGDSMDSANLRRCEMGQILRETVLAGVNAFEHHHIVFMGDMNSRTALGRSVLSRLRAAEAAPVLEEPDEPGSPVEEPSSPPPPLREKMDGLFVPVEHTARRRGSVALETVDELYRRMEGEGEWFLFHEGQPNFRPTYKLVPGTGNAEYNEKRQKSWCDRVLFRSVGGEKAGRILGYGTLPRLDASDHTPVYCVLELAMHTEATAEVDRKQSAKSERASATKAAPEAKKKAKQKKQKKIRLRRHMLSEYDPATAEEC